MANILITGGAGFLGSNLAEHLLSEGHAVRIFERVGARSPLNAELLRRVDWVEGDFTLAGEVDPALSDIEYVYHLASTTVPQTSNERPIFDVETNLVGTVRLMQAAHRAKIRRLIFASSGGTIYGPPRISPISEDHPTSPITSYGVVKLAAEKYLSIFHSAYGLDYAALRIANPYGPYQRPDAAQGAVGVFVARALADVPIDIWGDGNVVRDFVHVSDVCRALVAAMQVAKHRVLNVGSGKGHSLNELVSAIALALERTVAVNYLKGRSIDVPSNVLDISRIRAAYRWAPGIVFEDGIRATVDLAKEALQIK